MVSKTVLNNFSTPSAMKGIVEEIEINKLVLPEFAMHEDNSGDVDELALSIIQCGILNPIVIKVKDDNFEIISGTRRFLACKKLRWKKIPCHIIEVGDKGAFEISLVENIQRKNLSPIEEARAFKMYIDNLGWGGISDLASKISKSVPYVSKRLSLLELPENILAELRNLNISTSMAEELTLVKDKTQRARIANQAIKNNLTIREVRKLTEESFRLPSDQDTEDTQDMEIRVNRSFDKIITSLKIALNKIGMIIEDTDDNWVIYEILMQHKNMINSQIDILIKEKKRFNYKFARQLQKQKH